MRYILIVLLGMISMATQAQEKMSWRQHYKLANKLLENGQYADAGENYMLAWKQKPKKKALLYNAGKAFYTIKDYRKAAEAFAEIKKDLEEFPLIGLEYARCLKQDGQFELASKEFVYFINAYQNKDRAVIAQIVQNEIKGCEIAMLDKSRKQNDNLVDIELLNESINTPAAEFAPIAFSDDVLYFSSSQQAQVKIYRTQLQNGSWIKATAPSSFPKINNSAYANGCLSPDHQRFYFTICKEANSTWDGVLAPCEIFVTQRKNDSWTQPERLRDYINMKNSNTTHPFVAHVGDKEVLYFSSDREGGKGGMDIWCATRNISSKEFDFSFPENLAAINSIGDEITPSYDPTEERLYFSSNGLVGYGGFDVFQAKGKKVRFEKPENMAMPINSSADDYYYVKKPSGNGGYFSSNRLFGLEKITTTQDDLFSFSTPVKSFVIKGKILNKANDEPITEVKLQLYEKLANNRKRLLTTQQCSKSAYELELLPNKDLYIELSKKDFITSRHDFQTTDLREAMNIVKDMYMEQGVAAVVETPSTNPVYTPSSNSSSATASNSTLSSSLNKPLKTTYATDNAQTSDELKNTKFSTGTTSAYASSLPSTSNSSNTVYQAPIPKKSTTKIATNNSSSTASNRANSSAKINRTNATIVNKPTSYTMNTKDGGEIKTSSPRHSGVYYKVQIIAVKDYSSKHRRYDTVRHLGRLDTELIISKSWTRVLLADYYDIKSAEKVMLEARKNPQFFEAYIVRYEDGQRIGRWK